MESSGTAIRLRAVTKAFSGHVAVDGLTLDVPHGSVFGLLGPNGAGKTTTLRMIMDVLAPDSGTIEVLGRSGGRRSRDQIGYMPEERGLYPRMVLEEQLLYLAEIKGARRAEVRPRLKAWLERLGLAGWKRRRVNELSKGMQQKAQFVATVLHEPEVLILDEPMSGLDPVGTNLMRDLLLEMSRAGRTLVLSSHQMETVERLCDRVALLSCGHKLLDGTLADVKGRYGRNTVVLAFEGDGSFLGGLPGVRRLTDYGHYVELQVAQGSDVQVLLREAAARLRVSRFEIVEPSLHDIFVEQVTDHSG